MSSVNNVLITTYADVCTLLSEQRYHGGIFHSPSTSYRYRKTGIQMKNKNKDWELFLGTFHLKKRVPSCSPLCWNRNPRSDPNKIFKHNLKQTSYLRISCKNKILNNRLHNIRPTLKSNLSVYNKIIIYKSMLRPMRANGIQIWAVPNHHRPKQYSYIRIHRNPPFFSLYFSPWYVSNHSLHKDTNIEIINKIEHIHYTKLHA